MDPSGPKEVQTRTKNHTHVTETYFHLPTLADSGAGFAWFEKKSEDGGCYDSLIEMIGVGRVLTGLLAIWMAKWRLHVEPGVDLD